MQNLELESSGCEIKEVFRNFYSAVNVFELNTLKDLSQLVSDIKVLVYLCEIRLILVNNNNNKFKFIYASNYL